MRLKLKPYSLLFLLLVILGSCSKKINVPVPADSFMVMHIDGASLHSKLSWEEFKKGDLYKMIAEEAGKHHGKEDELTKKILDNPEASGIDIKSDAFLFMKIRGRGGYMGFTCSLKDEKAFAEMVEKITGDAPEKKDGLSIIKNSDAVLTWNSKRFVAIADNPALGEMSGGGFKGGSSYDSYSSRRFDQDSLIKFANEIYEMKTDNSAGGNEKFASMMKQSGDMHFWFNPGKLYGGTMSAMLAMTKFSTLMEGNYTAATLNFIDGKISVDSKSYINKDLAAIYEKYTMNNVDEDMLKKIPPGELLGVIAAKYPPQALKDLFTLLGVDGLVNVYLGELGYSLDEFIKAIKGDMMISVSDFSFKEREVKYNVGDQAYSYKSTQPDVKVLVAVSINDKVAFEKLTTLIQEKLVGDNESAKAMIAKFPYTIKDNWFIIGNDSASVYSFGNASTNRDFISKINGHPFGAYVDIQKILTGFNSKSSSPTNNMGSMEATIMTQSLKFWQDIVAYGSNIKNGSMDGHFEVNLVDKNVNALKQLNTYLGNIATEIKNNEKKMEDAAMNDVPSESIADSIRMVDSMAKPRTGIK